MALAAAAYLALAVHFELNERLGALLRGLEAFQVDELPGTLLVLAVGLGWYAWRRQRWAARESRARIAADVRLLASEERYRLLFTQTHTGIVVADAQGRVVEANPAMRALLSTGLQQSSLQDLYADPDAWHRHERLLRQGASVAEAELQLKGPEGRRIVIADLQRSGPFIHASFTDVTDLYAARARLSRALDENRELARRSIDLQERERHETAQELHDELGQYFHALAFEMAALRGQLDEAQHDALEIVRRMSGHVQHVQDVTRAIMNRLRPIALHELGLTAAIQHLLAAWRGRRPDLRFDYDGPEDLPPLAASIAIALFRVVQEGLTNAAKHAEASSVLVRTRAPDAAGDAIVVEIVDDGRGLVATRPGGVGLIGMRERIEGLGGTFETIGRPGSGTTLRATLPWPAEEHEQGAGA